MGRVIPPLFHPGFQHFTVFSHLLREVKINLLPEGYFGGWSEFILFLNFIFQYSQIFLSIYCVELNGFTEPQYR